MRMLLFAILFVPVSAQAGTSLLLGAWSKHLLTDEDYNETHNLVAVEYGSLFVGYFENSCKEDTFALGQKWSKSYGPIEVGLYGGVTYGYRDCSVGYADSARRVCPMVAPFVTLDTGLVSLQIYLLGEAFTGGFRVNL